MTVSTDQSVGTLRERTLDLPDGVKVRAIDEGHGPMVLLLHGNPDNADEWKTLIALLKDEFRCLAPDLPGYGCRGRTYTLPAQYAYTLEEQVRFVDEVLAHLDIQEKITLVVHDIGGIMGVPWAARNTNRLHAVVYTNTVAFPRHKWFALAYRWGKDSLAGRQVAQVSMAALGWFHGWLFRRVFSRQNPQLSQMEIERFVREFARNMEAKNTTLCEFRRLTRPDFFDGYDQLLKTISASVPTLALWGEDDPYIPDPNAAEALFAQKTIVLPSVGHWVPIVAAAALAEHIRSLHARL